MGKVRAESPRGNCIYHTPRRRSQKAGDGEDGNQEHNTTEHRKGRRRRRRQPGKQQLKTTKAEDREDNNQERNTGPPWGKSARKVFAETAFTTRRAAGPKRPETEKTATKNTTQLNTAKAEDGDDDNQGNDN